ncbi:DUF5813 family protein [Haloarchaeobius sp. HRN-SO-5]|uniref:DUF5813 family protein n=1 Tax=Haloarchaeobius sp. HRN-SO-5 TaxID=3446118 RepID=UPI003EBF7666
MTGLPESVERALERHDAFTRVDDEFAVGTTRLDAVVTAAPTGDDRDGAFRVTVRIPTLDAVVEGETVPPVVEDGWFETLELRLEDAFDVAHTLDHDDPTVERRGETVVATFTYRSGSARTGVEDAKAVAEFAEGTFVQGIVPGYDYGGPAAELLTNATQGGSSRSGGP